MSGQRPGNVPAMSSQRPGNPLCAGACRHAGCETKASRHAVTPQLRPQGKVSLPVASSAPARVRDELLFNFECPARQPCRPSSPAEQATTADADKVGSLSLKLNRGAFLPGLRLIKHGYGVGVREKLTVCAKITP
jgi:hypothetical protein